MAALNFPDLKPDRLEELRNLVSLPFANFLKASRQQIETRWRDELAELVSNKNSIAILVESGTTACGFGICTVLPWESALLGKSMWAIRRIGVGAGAMDRNSLACGLVAEINRRAKARAADFLLCKTTASDPVIIHALESNGYFLMDTLLDFVFDCRNPSVDKEKRVLPTNLEVRLATPADVDMLVEVAHASFAQHFGRFHADPRIGRASATKIYEEWIRSCVNGWADWVFVATVDESVAGYSAWKKASALDSKHGLRLGHHSIGCVRPAFSGRGIFIALTRAGMNELSTSVDWIEGPTHIENLPVQRAYLRLGWQIAGAQHSFHKWLAP
jgi:hypothetical protein